MRIFFASRLHPSFITVGRLSIKLSRAYWLLLVFALSTAVATAQDLAILWDVSQSVFSSRQGYRYPQEIGDTVSSLVFGRGVGVNWNIPPTRDSPAPISRALSGSAPLMGEGARVVVIRFGTRFREQYPRVPLFWHQDFSGANLRDLERGVAEAFPVETLEQLTNKELAMAGAAKYLSEQGSREWILLVISDFAQDQRNLNPDERQVRDSFLEGEFAERSPAVILRWRSDPDLQLYLELDRGKDAGEGKRREPGSSTLKLLNPAKDARLQNGARPTFSWSWSGQPPDKFFLVVTRIGSPVPVLERSTQATAVVAPQQLSSGEYRWQVFAQARNNSIASSFGAFTVEEGFRWWPVGLLLVIIALIVGIWQWNKRSSGGFHG